VSLIEIKKRRLRDEEIKNTFVVVTIFSVYFSIPPMPTQRIR
jgi:hypothetical protein